MLNICNEKCTLKSNLILKIEQATKLFGLQIIRTQIDIVNLPALQSHAMKHFVKQIYTNNYKYTHTEQFYVNFQGLKRTKLNKQHT